MPVSDALSSTPRGVSDMQTAGGAQRQALTYSMPLRSSALASWKAPRRVSMVETDAPPPAVEAFWSGGANEVGGGRLTPTAIDYNGG